MPTADPEPLSDERLDMLEDDFRAGRGCFSGWGLALVAEVRGLRTKTELLEIETKAWERLVYDNCGCLGSGYPKLPDDFNERWAAVAGEPHERREGP